MRVMEEGGREGVVSWTLFSSVFDGEEEAGRRKRRHVPIEVARESYLVQGQIASKCSFNLFDFRMLSSSRSHSPPRSKANIQIL
ncbi:hypothetical protein WAI453_008732 [Rhynchosporium graminicola]